MPSSDYQVHVVSRYAYERVKVGQAYSGGIVIDGIACGLTERLLLITYHGPEGEMKPPSTSEQVRSAPIAVTEAKRRFDSANVVRTEKKQRTLDV